MTNLVRAKELLLHGDLLTSLEFFQKAIEETSYDKSEKLFILDSICEISHSLEKMNTLESLKKLANGFYDVGQYKKSLFACKDALKLSDSFDLYELEIKNHKELGHVDELKKSIESFVKFLLKKRDTKKTIEVLFKNESSLQLSCILYYKINCYIIMGDISSIENIIKDLGSLSVPNKEDILKMFESNTLYWHKSSIIREWIVCSLAEPAINRFVTKKYVIKLLSDLFYHTEWVSDEIYEMTLKISEKWKLYGLGYTIAQLLKNEEKENMFLSKLPNVLISDEDFDLGGDYVSSSSELLEHEHINKINFLESIGKKAEAVKERQMFDQKFPNSLLMKKTTSLTDLPKKSDFSKTLDEIAKRGGVHKDEPEVGPLHVTFDYDNKSELFENYGEIASNLNMLREYEKVIALTDLLLSDIDAGETYIDINYLKIEALLKLEKFFEARDLAEKILLEGSLSVDKKRTFDYLLAESYFLMKEYKKAKYIFMEIYKNNKAYRLTKNRLKHIEENQ